MMEALTSHPETITKIKFGVHHSQQSKFLETLPVPWDTTSLTAMRKDCLCTYPQQGRRTRT